MGEEEAEWPTRCTATGASSASLGNTRLSPPQISGPLSREYITAGPGLDVDGPGPVFYQKQDAGGDGGAGGGRERKTKESNDTSYALRCKWEQSVSTAPGHGCWIRCRRLPNDEIPLERLRLQEGQDRADGSLWYKGTPRSQP